MSLSIICLEKSTNYITVCPEFTRGSGLSPLLEGGAHVVSGPPNQQRREIPLYPVSLLSTVEKCSTSYTVKMRAMGHLLWSFLPLSHCTSGCAGGTCLEWRTDPPIWGICSHGIRGHWKASTRAQESFAHPVLSFELREWMECSSEERSEGKLGAPPLLVPLWGAENLHDEQETFFFFFQLFFFFAVLGLCCFSRTFSSCRSGGYSLLGCAGFSVRWLVLLLSTGSRHMGFSCSTWAQ